MIRNCRNCKFAQWHRNAAGAKQYGNWAACSKVVELPVGLPASVAQNWGFRDLTEMLNKPRAVASSDKGPVDCPTWEKE